MTTPTNREAAALLPILQSFGVPRDGILIVHSAIGLLSRQGFRAERMIETFLEWMRDGHVFMPTMTWRTVTPDHPNWDEMATPSHTGVMSEIFRAKYSTARSIHPTHSVAGCGPVAKFLCSRHHIDNTPVSANSPYGLMRDYDAYVLMLGVSLESCTAVHLPEEQMQLDLYVRPVETAVVYPCRDRHGTVHNVLARRHWRLDRDFNRFNAPLAALGMLEQGAVEGCPYTIVSMADLLRSIFMEFGRNPRATLSEKAQTGPIERV